MKRPIFFTSFFSTNCRGSKFFTSAAIWHANWEVSKCVILPTPLLPASRFFHTCSVLLPTPQTRPIPVTTTLRCKLLAAFRMLADVVDRILDGANLLGVFIGNLDFEGFFEGHHQFYGVQRVGTEVVHERGAVGDFGFVHSELFHDDLLYFFVNGCHVSPRCARFFGDELSNYGDPIAGWVGRSVV